MAIYVQSAKLSAASLVIAVLLSGCATTSATMKSWVGATENELVASWGAPDTTTTLPDGNKLDTWVTNSTNKSGVHVCAKTFTIDSQGKVTQWSCSSGCGLFIGRPSRPEPKLKQAPFRPGL
jgi:hypothetical protein